MISKCPCIAAFSFCYIIKLPINADSPSIYITNLPSIHEKHVPSVVSQFGLWKGQSASLVQPAVLCLDDTKLVASLVVRIYYVYVML